MAATIAGIAVAMHWGALFVSQLVLGVVGDRMPYNATLTVSVVGIVVGLALLWWNPAGWVAIFGLVLAGFASGPVFPLQMLLTPRRFGSEFSPWAVGYQLSAAIAAIAVIPGAIGILVNEYGPLVIGPVLVVMALIMSVSVEVLRITASNEVPSTTAV